MIESRTDYLKYLEEDKKALRIKSHKGLKSCIKDLVFPNLIWRFEKLLRKVEYFGNVVTKSSNPVKRLIGGALYVFYSYKFRKLSLRLGYSIPPNTFGPGLAIAHYGTIIVNSGVRVGAFCRLHASVNIGASSGSIKTPQIGDNVYIGPSVVIFGNIHIANNVTIGANATVNKDCLQENVVLAGTPAKIVKEHAESWVVFNHLFN